MSEKIVVFDTTLRDGEQSAGVCFTRRDKLEIAEALAALGVDVIEAGFPGASPAEVGAVAAVAGAVREAVVCGLARAVAADVDAAGAALHRRRRVQPHGRHPGRSRLRGRNRPCSARGGSHHHQPSGYGRLCAARAGGRADRRAAAARPGDRGRRDLLSRPGRSRPRHGQRPGGVVEERSGLTLAPNKAIVGRNAFRHASGIHQDGVLKWRESYEVLDPREIGHPHGSQIVLGKLSGRAGFAARAAALGRPLGGAELDRAFARFQCLADRRREVGDAELRRLLDDDADDGLLTPAAAAGAGERP